MASSSSSSASSEMRSINIYSSPESGTSYLCESKSTLQGVDLSYHNFNKEVDNLLIAVDKEVLEFRAVFTIHANRKSWWRYVAPFFVQIFRQVCGILISIYQSGRFHGCLCMNCILINENGDVLLLLKDTCETHTLQRDLADLRQVMVAVLCAPYRGDDFNLEDYPFPADLKRLLVDLQEEWDTDLVKIEFLLDRPLFWKPEETRFFFNKFMDLSYREGGDIECVLLFRKILDYIGIPVSQGKEWTLFALGMLQNSLIGFVPDPEFPKPALLSRNGSKHYREPNRLRVISEAGLLRRTMSWHPTFSALPTHLRRAIMELSKENGGSKWVWSQTQLVSSKISPDIRHTQ